MSLKLAVGRSIPEETRQIAKAAFPKGNVYLWIGDELGELYADYLFNDLYPVRGQPTISPERLALITILQFMEGLTDRQAAEAVRGRIDWKYALGLELTDPGFDFSVLSEFRERLSAGQQEQTLLNVLLDELKQRGWLKARSKQRTDSTHVLASVRQLNRLEMVGETMRQALNELNIVRKTLHSHRYFRTSQFYHDIQKVPDARSTHRFSRSTCTFSTAPNG